MKKTSDLQQGCLRSCEVLFIFFLPKHRRRQMDMKGKGRGRSRVLDDGQSVGVYMDSDDLARLRKAAKKGRVSMSAVIRQLVSTLPPVETEN
jgi:hypothetical protein